MIEGRNVIEILSWQRKLTGQFKAAGPKNHALTAKAIGRRTIASKNRSKGPGLVLWARREARLRCACVQAGRTRDGFRRPANGAPPRLRGSLPQATGNRQSHG